MSTDASRRTITDANLFPPSFPVLSLLLELLREARDELKLDDVPDFSSVSVPDAE